MCDAAGHTFSSLQCEHTDLERLFEKHQRALISRDVPVAFATIVTFESNLTRHIAFEEEVLLPLYKTKGGEVEGGTLPIFQAEHRKLREIVARLAQHTDRLYTRPDIVGAILEFSMKKHCSKGLWRITRFANKTFCFHASTPSRSNRSVKRCWKSISRSSGTRNA
jgi:hypothetical protein